MDLLVLEMPTELLSQAIFVYSIDYDSRRHIERYQ
jgi:hypothetical protein